MLETNPSLLVRIRDLDDAQAWNQFVEIYAPLIHDYGRRRGLQDADAADLAQDVLQAVARSAGRFEYDRTRGAFRGWLLTITRNKLIDLLQRRKRASQEASDKNLDIDQLADDPNDVSLWERQHQWWLVRWSADQVRHEFEEKTWQAFISTAIEQKTAAETASLLNMSVGAVYIAKSRVLARVKHVIEDVEGDG